MQSESRPLFEAASAVAAAVEVHARMAADEDSDVASVISAGVALRDAVLQYEERLIADTGWSNPIRHLGRLPVYTKDDDLVAASGTGSAPMKEVRVKADYVVGVADEALLFNFVESRGGERPSTVVDAVRFLFESDSWDAWQYPPGRLRLLDVGVTYSLTKHGR